MKQVYLNIFVFLIEIVNEFLSNTVIIFGHIGRANSVTHIRLLLEEQSDQGLHCLLFHLHFFDEIPCGLASLFEF